MRLGQRLKTLEEAAGSARRVVLFCVGNYPAEKRDAMRVEKASKEGVPPENVDMFVIHTGVPQGTAA